MRIRKAKKSDINEICKLIANTFSFNDWVVAKKEINEMFSKSINKPIYVVLLEKNKIIALTWYIQSWFSYDWYEIFWVAVSPDYQNKWIWKKIINNVVDRIRKKLKDNKQKNINIVLTTKSIGFFNKCWFKVVEESKNIDASSLMIKTL